MEQNNEMAVSSGIFHIGANSKALKSFRDHYEWLKWYYSHKGFRFSDVRKHVLARYDFVVEKYPFKDLFQWYTYHMQMHYRNEICRVVNDNDYFSYCCAATRIPLNSEALPRHLYPLLKSHPMSAFLGHRIAKFGYFSMRNLADRLSKK